MGLCVPVRDAAWETSNLYEDLYQKPKCIVDDCKAVQLEGEDTARWKNTLDSSFELMNCDVCGSKSTHLSCSDLTTPLDDWTCPDCDRILKEANIEAPSGKAMIDVLDDADDKEEEEEADCIDDDDLEDELAVGSPDEEKEEEGDDGDSDVDSDEERDKKKRKGGRKKLSKKTRKGVVEDNIGRKKTSALSSWLKQARSSSPLTAAARQGTLDSWFSAAEKTNAEVIKMYNKNHFSSSSSNGPKLKKISFHYEIDEKSGGNSSKKETFKVTVGVKRSSSKSPKKGVKRKGDLEEAVGEKKRKKTDSDHEVVDGLLGDEDVFKMPSTGIFKPTVPSPPAHGYFWIHYRHGNESKIEFGSKSTGSGSSSSSRRRSTLTDADESEIKPFSFYNPKYRFRYPTIVSHQSYKNGFDQREYVSARRGLERAISTKPRVKIDRDVVDNWWIERVIKREEQRKQVEREKKHEEEEKKLEQEKHKEKEKQLEREKHEEEEKHLEQEKKHEEEEKKREEQTKKPDKQFNLKEQKGQCLQDDKENIVDAEKVRQQSGPKDNDQDTDKDKKLFSNKQPFKPKFSLTSWLKGGS